jgi:uncharacterized protein
VTWQSMLYHYPVPERREEVARLMARVRDRVAGIPGCLEVGVWQEQGGDAMVAVSRWESRDALLAAREQLAAASADPDLAFDGARESRPRELRTFERIDAQPAPAAAAAPRPPKYVVFYESADDVLHRAPAHYPAHRARLEEFHARGALLLVGTFGDPQAEGSMSVFTSREAAEEFVRGDPFVLNGVVRAWQLREWREILGAR